MNDYEKFKEACKEPVSLEECYIALQQLIDRKHTMHVPPRIDDADMVISRALRELKEYREGARNEMVESPDTEISTDEY